MARTRAAAASRPRKASDDVYNARRRFRRQAERYEKKAAMAMGVEKSRYLAQARAAIGKALETYQGKQKPQGAVKAAAQRLGVEALPVSMRNAGKVRESELQRLMRQSRETLASVGRKATRDQVAREILKTGNIGSRFYGGLVQVWDATEETRRHPDRAILDYFKADSIMDVLEDMEAAGIDIYSPIENDTEYKSIQLRVQKYILQSRSQDEEILL